MTFLHDAFEIISLLGLCIIVICVLVGVVVIINGISGIYMDENDPNNPVGYTNLYITYGVKLVADDITRDIPGEHNKTIAVLKYIDENIRINNTVYEPHPHIILEKREGLCGHFAILAASLVSSSGVPSRIVAMCGNKTHVGIEVYYDNAWHYYDPTFFVYWEKEGTVLSFSELKSGGARDATLRVGNITRYNLYEGTGYLTPEYYENAYPSGVPTRECPLTSNCKPCS